MTRKLNRRSFMINTVAGISGASALMQTSAGAAEKHKDIWPFYAFDNGLRSRSVRTLKAKVELLKRLGYVGLQYHYNPRQMPKMLDALDKHDLEMNGLYYVPLIEGTLDKRLPDVVKMLKGRRTRIDLAIRSKKFGPSDTKGDPGGLDLVKRISDMCADTGPVVSIYPHTGIWTERVEDGVRIAKALDRENVGTGFNLVHWKWVKQTTPLEKLLTNALPHLFGVTINGLKGRQIVSLDRGDFDLLGFMATVKTVGYTGQVGLQCYNVKGPSEEHLKRSMDKWRDMLKKLDVR